MGNGLRLLTGWQLALLVFILYGCFLFYVGAVMLLAGEHSLIDVLVLLFLPVSLLGIRKHALASASLAVLGVLYVVSAFVPLAPDPFGPAVPDQAGYARDVILLLALPTLAASAVLRWKAKRS